MSSTAALIALSFASLTGDPIPEFTPFPPDLMHVCITDQGDPWLRCYNAAPTSTADMQALVDCPGTNDDLAEEHVEPGIAFIYSQGMMVEAVPYLWRELEFGGHVLILHPDLGGNTSPGQRRCRLYVHPNPTE